MNQTLFMATNWLSHISILWPFIMYYKKNGAHIDDKKFLYFYLILSVLFEVVTLATEMNKIRDHVIVNVFLVLEFIFLSYYLKWILDDAIFKKLIILFQIIFSFICIYTFLVVPDIAKINNNIKSSAAIFLIASCLFYYYEILKKIKVPKLTADPYFWTVCAIFFYFCSTFIISIFSRELLWAKQETARQMYFIILIFTIIYRFMLGIGLWNIPHTK